MALVFVQLHHDFYIHVYLGICIDQAGLGRLVDYDRGFCSIGIFHPVDPARLAY